MAVFEGGYFPPSGRHAQTFEPPAQWLAARVDKPEPWPFPDSTKKAGKVRGLGFLGIARNLAIAKPVLIGCFMLLFKVIPLNKTKWACPVLGVGVLWGVC